MQLFRRRPRLRGIIRSYMLEPLRLADRMCLCAIGTVRYRIIAFIFPCNNPCLVSQICHVDGLQSGDIDQFLHFSCTVPRNSTAMYRTVHLSVISYTHPKHG